MSLHMSDMGTNSKIHILQETRRLSCALFVVVVINLIIRLKYPLIRFPMVMTIEVEKNCKNTRKESKY